MYLPCDFRKSSCQVGKKNSKNSSAKQKKKNQPIRSKNILAAVGLESLE